MENRYPAFLTQAANEVLTDDMAGGLQGFVFDGADGTQVVFWQSRNGQAGYCEPHSHDYGEYCHVLNGTYRLCMEGREILLQPGDEICIAPGVEHSGWYSADYRAIDGFERHRFERISSQTL